MARQLTRWSVALVGTAGLFMGVTAPAGAAEEPVEGSYAGEAMLTSRPEDCPNPPTLGIGHTVDATGTLTTLGDVEVDGLVCLLEPQPAISGTFTITAAAGTISGDMTGTLISRSGTFGPYDEDMTVTITGGTGELEGATGTLYIDGVFVLTSLDATGTVSGSITLPPNTPASKDDCKDGGWQDFEDENGEPFANQGDCIAWVNHHP